MERRFKRRPREDVKEHDEGPIKEMPMKGKKRVKRNMCEWKIIGGMESSTRRGK